MVDQFGRGIALGLGHRLQNPRLGYAVQIILSGRLPPGGGHVERHGAGELVGMVPAALCPVPRLMHSIDGERGAMGEERHPAVMIKVAEEFPEQLGFIRHLLFPIGLAVLNGLCRWAFLQVRPLHGKAAAFPCDLQAAIGGVAVEGLERQPMQHGDEGDVRIARQRVAQGQRPVRGEFHDQPVGQRLDAFVLLVWRRITGKRRDRIDLPRFTIGTDMDDFDMIADEGVGCIAIGLILRLVLGPDIATFDLEPTVTVNADKNTRAGNLSGIVNDGLALEGIECSLDFGKPPVDLLGQVLVRARVALLDLRHFVAQGFALCLFLIRQRLHFAHDTTQIASMPIGEVLGDLDPAPAFRLNRLSFTGQLRGDQAFQERHVLQPAIVILRKQIA